MTIPNEDRKLIIDDLVNDLCEHNYPVELMKKDYEVYPGCEVDLAIIDTEKEPIAFFMIALESWDKTKETLIRIANRIKEPHIPCFVVNPNFTGDKQNYDLMFLRPLVSEKRHLIQVQSIEEASQRIIPYIVLNKRSLHKQIEKAVDKVMRDVCWTLASVLLILDIIDFIINKGLTIQNVSLIAVIVGLTLAPFIRKFKSGLIEYER